MFQSQSVKAEDDLVKLEDGGDVPKLIGHRVRFGGSERSTSDIAMKVMQEESTVTKITRKVGSMELGSNFRRGATGEE